MRSVRAHQFKKGLCFLVFHLCLLATGSLQAQDSIQEHRLQQINHHLEIIKADSPGLDQHVEMSISEVPLDEFLRNLAKEYKLNFNIAPNLNTPITNNFSNITVAEILHFLAVTNSLDFQFSGNIISITAYQAPVELLVYAPKSLNIILDSVTGNLTVDFKNDSISLVTRQLTKFTKRNIVFAPQLAHKKVNLYVEDAPLSEVLNQLAFANEMVLTSINDSLFHLTHKTKENTAAKAKRNNKKKRNMELTVNSDGTINIRAEVQPLSDIIKTLFQELNIDFYYYNELQSTLTLNVYNEPLNKLLDRLFYGTKYTYRQKDKAYYFGDRTLEGLRETRRIHMMSRSVEDIVKFIPKNLTADVEIIEFHELNSLIVSGSFPQIEEIEEFLSKIDHPVPVIQIEVIIIDYNRNHNMETGIEMGLGAQPATTTGTMSSGGINMTMGAQSINSIINSFNGFGALNLGPVTSNFYLSLKAMETNGVIKTRSTPKLATLNGTEATITIGQTEYYVVENQSLQGVQNPIPLVTRSYNQVQADFKLTIKPFLAGDDQVTLTIEVTQSDFTARIEPNAPPGQVTRTFNTIIRVKNEEMILLGGLEETTKEDTGSGVPFLSRIPVIKWFFSSRVKRKADNRLNIFIKPTIIN